MPQLDDLHRAYELLDVPPQASALAIKRAYRAMVLRWHPDRRAPGTVEYSDATEMMKRINHAYLLIASAPLRYHRGPIVPPAAAATAPSQPASTSYAARAEVALDADGNPLGFDPIHLGRQIEFSTRFICGFLFGLLTGLRMALRANSGAVIVISMVCFGVAFGLAAVRFGDDFWYSTLRGMRR